MKVVSAVPHPPCLTVHACVLTCTAQSDERENDEVSEQCACMYIRQYVIHTVITVCTVASCMDTLNYTSSMFRCVDG